MFIVVGGRFEAFVDIPLAEAARSLGCPEVSNPFAMRPDRFRKGIWPEKEAPAVTIRSQALISRTEGAIIAVRRFECFAAGVSISSMQKPRLVRLTHLAWFTERTSKW